MLIGGVLALVGLIVNAAVDLDNVYDMTTSALWVLTVILVFAGAFMGGGTSETSRSAMASSPATTQQYKCNACGMSFNSESELTDHVKRAHPMPAK